MAFLRKSFKWAGITIPSFLIIFLGYYHKEVAYGISQGIAQIRIIKNARPVSELMHDPSVPDSVKQKILLISDIKKFAVDSLGITPSESYTSYYDQQGKPILWVVTACPAYKLEPYEWRFPIAGGFTYKGFFDYEKAVGEENRLKKLGYDTNIEEVSAWSTLGWFNDPILSSMLKRKPGSLANLIIHEMTHGTLYVRDDVRFNENLASFVGDKGAIRFLKYKYGENSSELEEYRTSHQARKVFRMKVLELSSKLSSLYESFTDETREEEKYNQKQVLISEIKDSLLNYLPGGKNTEELAKVNNTFFMDYIRYHSQEEEFESEFSSRYSGDLKKYINYLKDKYPSL
ncbi:MAG: aminopeptidase [Cytophagaceae bacterium]